MFIKAAVNWGLGFGYETTFLLQYDCRSRYMYAACSSLLLQLTSTVHVDSALHARARRNRLSNPEKNSEYGTLSTLVLLLFVSLNPLS